MNTYEVKVTEVNVWIVKVQADSFDEASSTAKENVMDHEHSGELVDGYVEANEVARL